MKILAVDDERLQLKTLVKAINEASNDAEVIAFGDSLDAFEYAENNRVDVAFLDIQMPGMDGITLARRIKEIQPRCNIIFSTAYDEYAYTAMTIHASGYITKPIEEEAVKEELENLRYDSFKWYGKGADGEAHKIYIHCFGNFEMFIDGKPFEFPGEKARELVAYLAHRDGAVCLNSEISAVIFEDGKDHTSYITKLRRELKNSLKKAGCEEVIMMGWGKMALRRDLVECDYYEWLEGTARGINAYQGEYMAQYSWAEFTNAMMMNK